ncbi:MAG: hypothetical protein IT330_05535 [Anaerolineae bacterium]|nr:hypothetical protein [Anaerolineae bacterium]
MTLQSQLGTLETSGLIRQAQADPEYEYLFKHNLVQETAYESLLRQDRKRLHLAVGEALERLYPGRQDELATLLGQHFYEAGDDPRALRYLTLAGDLAARRYANTEALQQYTQALEVARRTPNLSTEEFTHLYVSRGRVLEISGRYPEAAANYEEMEALSGERNDLSLRLAALMHRATIHSAITAMHSPEQAQLLADRGLVLARHLGNREAEARILWNLMHLHFFTSRVDEAIQYGEQSLAIARELNLREQLAYTLNDLGGMVYWRAGYAERKLPTLTEARSLWRELGNLPMLADNLTSSANHLAVDGEFAQALDLADEAYRISHPIGNLWGQAYSQGVRGAILLQIGESEQALTALDEALRRSDEAGFLAGRTITLSNQAHLFGLLGTLDEGLNRAREAVAHAEARVPFWLAQALGGLALIHIYRGEYGEAERAMQRVSQVNQGEDLLYIDTMWLLADFELGMVRQTYSQLVALAEIRLERLKKLGARALLPYVLYYRGMAFLEQRQVDEAYAALVQARVEAETRTVRHIWWKILAALSRVERARGNQTAAKSFCQQAREIVDFIAERAGSPQLRASFLSSSSVRAVLEAA